MKQVIYIDVLIFLNTVITFLLLLASSRLIKIKPKPGRLVVGALVGGASSLVIFAPDMGFAVSLLVKLLFSVVITTVTYKSSSVRAVLRNTGYFFAVSFIFAGMILFVASLPGISIVTYNNGAVYVELSFFSLVAASVICYVVTLILNKITGHSRNSDVTVNAEITAEGQTLSCSAVIDTGNALTDPFSGENIIIGDKLMLNSILPTDIRLYLDGNEEICSRIRLVSCVTVSGNGLLPVFRADMLVIFGKEEKIIIRKPLIAVCDREISHMILPAILLEQEERRPLDVKNIS